jgi:SAM-dependent methyltransferase
MDINNWNEKEVKRAETTWGHTFPEYTKDMYNFATSKGSSFLDLGCGFGRFLEYLLDVKLEPDYIGYDSSPVMIDRIRERFPEYFTRVFVHNITDKITHPQESIVISAVLIHLTQQHQKVILNNISELRPLPKSITFDINSPSDRLKIKQSDFERIILTTKDSTGGFRMTWQSHYDMTDFVLQLFSQYSLTTKFYDLKQGRKKVLYMLELK